MHALLPKYQDLDRRRESYEFCTSLEDAQRAVLVRNGFIYVRFSRTLHVCHACGCQYDTRDYGEQECVVIFEDMIRTTHVVSNPFCPHLYMTLGSDFIFNILENSPLHPLICEFYSSTFVPDDYMDAGVRKTSLEKCRERTSILPEIISANGFYFCEMKDSYVCFYCDATFRSLKDFAQPIDLYEHHAAKGLYCRMNIFHLGRKATNRILNFNTDTADADCQTVETVVID